MNLSALAIQRPVFAWILMIGLIFFGVVSFRQMGINENPDVDFPVVTVNYSYQGASPVVIEKDIIEPAENVLVSMEGIRNISSVAERGSARITIEFELSRDIDFALQETQTLLARAQAQLPETIENPVITKANADDDPIIYLALRAEGISMRDLMILFRDRIRDRLATIKGVAEVRPFGYHEPMLRIDLNAEKLKKFELTAQDVVDSIRREHAELPAGKLEFGDDEDLIRIMGEASEVEEFENMVISRRGGAPNFAPLRIKDVARVYEGIENLRRVSRVNGVTAMGMAIQKQRGVNAAATADRVIERLEEINATLPEGVKLQVNFDRTQFIRESVNELVFTLFLSALLTSIVCWLFLGSWSATFNILLAIPTAIVGSFIFINAFGFTLNTFSLLGLALAIGVVVDDAIIMLENIVRYMQMGFDRVNASFKGAREITFAVIATTLALISVFIPITFITGIEGRFFFEFAVTIAVAVSLSSLEALTLAPMRCSQFLNLTERTTWFGRQFEGFLNWLRNQYKMSLEWSLKRPKSVLVGSVIVFLLSLIPVFSLESEFIPAQDRGVLSVIFLAPEGKSMQYTDQKVREFEKIVGAHPAVERTFVAIGGFGEGGQGNRGNGLVILKDVSKRSQTQAEVATELKQQLDAVQGLRIILRDRFGASLGGRRGSPVEYTLSGPDTEQQEALYLKMKEEMEKTGLFVGVRSDDTQKLPEVQIVPDRQAAIRQGVEVAEIAGIINATFGGLSAAQYTTNNTRFDIFVQLAEEDRQQQKDLDPVLVRNNRGELLPLKSVVKVQETATPQYVFREDRIRGIRVDSNLAEGAKEGTAVSAIREIAKKVLPDKYYIRFSSTPQEKGREALIVMLLGLVMAYMVLASQFNSFFDPVLVFLAIPFGLTGSLLALYGGGQTLNAYSVIGILLTMGIVKKNSILLVEFANQLRDQGKDSMAALMEACPVRLRPILMTTTATLAAAVPPAISLGPGSETQIPLALTVLGGVSFSLLLTLYVVPSAYLLFSPQRRETLVETQDPGLVESAL